MMFWNSGFSRLHFGTEPGAVATGSSTQLALWICYLCRPLRGLGFLRGRDPWATLAALAHPGLLSAAAPRLVASNINDESLRRNFAYTLWRDQQLVGSARGERFSRLD
jgi:hypothetical protein